MSGIRDTATVTLNINGAQAKQMMSDLEKRITDTKNKISDLKAKMADPKEIQRARKELKSYEKQMDELKSATEGVNTALTNLDSATPRQLEKALRTLNKQLKDMPPGSETWDSHIEKIKQLKGRLEEIKSETKDQESLWGKFKTWSTEAWPAIDLLDQWSQGFVDLARETVEAFASMDQEMANVRKFTGLTAEEVEGLNEQFKKMDTRTSREDLNKLAQEAGRLGKTAPEEIMGFVRAADKINVALDDLGEGATLTLSKLTGIFGDEKRLGTEKALLSVGSVINELSQNCSASAPYLAEFASRMGGVGAQAGMTIQQIMGFGAVLDSNEQKVEASSTALSQVLVRMMQDPAKYARAAGLDVQKFSTMLKEDANGALLMFLDTLQKAGGMDVLSPMFKDMGENGSRAIAALSTLATHIDEVKAQQAEANKAFAEATSIDKEFNVQNNTVQAGIDKCKKAAQELRVELGEKLQPVVAHVLTSSAAIIKVLFSLVSFIMQNKVAIGMLTVELGTYAAMINFTTVKTIALTTAQKVWAALCKALPATMGLLRMAYAALANGINYFTLGLEVNYEMQQRWRNAVRLFTSASPAKAFMVMTTAALVLSQTIARLIASHQEEDAALDTLNKVKTDAATKTEEEKIKIEQLIAAASDMTAKEEERIAACNKLNKIVPDMTAQIDKQTKAFSYSKQALDKYLQSLNHLYEIEGAKDQLKELGKERAQLIVQQKDLTEKRAQIAKEQAQYNSRAAGNFGYSTTSGGFPSSSFSTNLGFSADTSTLDVQLDKVNDKLSENLAKTQLINKTYGVMQLTMDTTDQTPESAGAGGAGGAAAGGAGGAAASGSGSSGASSRFAEEKAWKEREEALARISYAKGESDYEQYTLRMAQIQEDYYQKILDRDDVAGDERLGVLANYWDAVNKHTQASSEKWIGWENAAYEEDIANLKKLYADKLEAGNMSAEEREAAEKAHEEALELAELEHLSRLVFLTEEGTKERSDAEEKYLDARLKASKRHQEEYEKSQKEHEDKLASFKDKYFGLNAAEKKESYDKDLAALTEVYNAELAAAGNNADEKLRIEKAFLDAKRLLKNKYDQEDQESGNKSMQQMAQDQIDWLQGDGGKALTSTLDTLVSGMSSIFSGLSTLMQAELEIQTAAINKRYDAEIDAAEGNSYKVKKLEEQKEKEIAKAKNEANRKMFAMQVIQAVAQTAQNAIAAYGSALEIPVVGLTLAPIAAAMAVAAGAIQIAAIKKQAQASESQGYSQGGFTRPGAVDEPAGIVHAGEWVASQKLLASPVARPMIEALDYAQRTNTIGSLNSEDVSRSIRATDAIARISESDGSAALMVAALAQNAQVVGTLNDRLQQPLGAIVTVTGEHGINHAQDEYDKYIRNKSPKSKK